MSERALKAAGAAQRGHGAVEQLPRAIAEDAARRAKARRGAWLLGGLAVFFYVGYIAWMVVRASMG